jgi:uncharacterized membrane protein
MYFSLFFAITMFLEAVYLFNTGMIGDPLYGMFYIGIYRYPISLLFFLFGIYCLFVAYKIYQRDKYRPKIKQAEYSICPNCKETFTYEELKNGKCKYCDDVDTVDIDGYYDDPKP